MEPEDLVPVCTVNNPTEAELIRSALQSAGIACQIGGEGQAGFAGVFQIDVLTHASDAKAARKLLRQIRHDKIERKRKRIAKRKAKADGTSEAIQEMPPRKKPPTSE